MFTWKKALLFTLLLLLEITDFLSSTRRGLTFRCRCWCVAMACGRSCTRTAPLCCSAFAPPPGAGAAESKRSCGSSSNPVPLFDIAGTTFQKSVPQCSLRCLVQDVWRSFFFFSQRDDQDRWRRAALSRLGGKPRQRKLPTILLSTYRANPARANRKQPADVRPAHGPASHEARVQVSVCVSVCVVST